MRLTLLLLISVCANAQFFPFPGPGTIAHSGGGGGGAVFKGESHDNQDAASNTISTPGTLNISSGDWVVVFTGWVGTSTPPTITCSTDTLTQAAQLSETGSNYHVFAFYKENATVNSAATCSVAIASSETFRFIAAANYSGVLTSGSLKNTSCNTVGCSGLAASSTSRTAQNITTTTANALLVGLGIDWNGGGTRTAANGYTLHISGVTPFLFDKNVSATGTYPSGSFGTVNPADQYMSIFLVVGLQ